MNIDPLFRKIVERLSGPVNGDTFERCAQDLLRDVYPSLTPVVGGNDAGMDGAIGTAEGAFPLICTTSGRVIENVRKNAKAYLAKRAGPKRLVIATTQNLSPQRKRNLEQEAEGIGLVIANIHDQPYFADRLYRDSKWRMELLGVTGEPRALSAFPLRGRLSPPEVLVGREDVLRWLEETGGDLLLVGQPGSGKTCLHQHLAQRGLCLFAIDSDATRLADAIREQTPSIIVVDDAHLRPELLLTLRRLRVELGAAYSIHANCWPREDEAVRRALDLSHDAVRVLEPLTRDEIVQLIQHVGVFGPDVLLQILLEQSDGKPGLAAELAAACKREGVEKVWRGDLLAGLLLADRRLMPGETERCVLAAFALGGDAGMSWSAVASALQMSPVMLREVTAALGAGGVVEEIGVDRLQVRPPALRPLLVRDVFFGGGIAIDWRPLVTATPSVHETAHVLLSTRQRGGHVDLSLLEQLAAAADRREVWEHFAGADESCAVHVLDRYPEKAAQAAPGLLHFRPSRALALLLEHDAVSTIPSEAAVDHPRRRISDWLIPEDLDGTESIERRRTLLDAVTERGERRLDPSCAWALAELMRPDFHLSRMKPGSGLVMVFTKGLFGLSTLKDIADLWPKVLSLLVRLPPSLWRTVLDRMEGWCLPQRYLHSTSDAEGTDEFMRQHGRRMLRDVLALPACTRPCRLWAERLSRWSGEAIDAQIDPVFARIFAEHDHAQDYGSVMKRRLADLGDLADHFTGMPAPEAVAELAAMEREVAEFGGIHGGWERRWLYAIIAERVGDPGHWVELLLSHELDPTFVVPFLEAVGNQDRDALLQILGRLLHLPRYAERATLRVMDLPDPPSELLDDALDRLVAPERDNAFWLSSSRIPVRTMRRLLEHRDRSVRAAAALGEWLRDPTGEVRPEVGDSWGAALLDVGDSYQLGEIFKARPELAFRWIEARLTRGQYDLWQYRGTVSEAAKLLTRQQRCELLMLVNSRNFDEECFDALLADDAELFTSWLKLQPNPHYALQPLRRVADARWERMALAAFDAGLSPEQVAEHCTPSHWGGFGPMSNYLQTMLPVYEHLSQHPDSRLRLAGQRGLSWVQARLKLELKSERDEAVRGR